MVVDLVEASVAPDLLVASLVLWADTPPSRLLEDGPLLSVPALLESIMRNFLLSAQFRLEAPAPF